jgi:thiamine-phosphate pyrophosphorylase
MASGAEHLADRLSVYLVADPDQTDHDLCDAVKAALAGGVTAVQLRMKSGTDRQMYDLASALAVICAEHSAPFFVNDRFDIALTSCASGIHLGADDLPVNQARLMASKSFVIGYSPKDDNDASAASLAGTEIAEAGLRGADYFGIGPVFGTQSKPDAGEALGLESFSRRVKVAGIPCIGIGGIDAANAASVIEAGAVGVAVMSAILRAPDPEKAAAELASFVHEAKANGRRPA